MRKHVVIAVTMVCLGPALLISIPAVASTPQHLNAFSEGERLLYMRVVEAFSKNAMEDAIRQRQALAHHFPSSIHLDNAYYLTGVLQFQAGRYSEAVRDFGTVETRFPHSNKRPAAMFAKAMTYEKLGLKPQATRLMKLIVQEYPGSQESQRAFIQLKAASLTPKKLR